jgi:hypothetical protein
MDMRSPTGMETVNFFNPRPTISVVPLLPGKPAIVVDDALTDPDAFVEWSAAQAFERPRYPFPGLVLPAPDVLMQRISDFFAQHVRARLGGRRTLDVAARLSLVTTRPEELDPRQWQCHRDRVSYDDRVLLHFASVLYLFRDPALGGTSFYVPKRPLPEIDRMIADAERLGAAEFTSRYGVQPGYMVASNAWYEQIASLPARWNRMVFYDGSIFHSGDVISPERLTSDPRTGRFSVNSFITCKRSAA